MTLAFVALGLGALALVLATMSGILFLDFGVVPQEGQGMVPPSDFIR
ncbi:MAG: hypothetical protein AVDCRST_MAG89-2787 [uncultured Gemmatimonadetes bacterium]|uniref:Uncharacterized protein n=1 Tax=uncultured Gemmatimonadota bacterium TaxID=203437 RepID=A0A6J4LYS2_9BACT|nr:MAG: hypothetical protein AVDCRST_MAG89-2787 [uncultured Gemmatimonadota bacterium]